MKVKLSDSSPLFYLVKNILYLCLLVVVKIFALNFLTYPNVNLTCDYVI